MLTYFMSTTTRKFAKKSNIGFISVKNMYCKLHIEMLFIDESYCSDLNGHKTESTPQLSEKNIKKLLILDTTYSSFSYVFPTANFFILARILTRRVQRKLKLVGQ